MFKKIIVAPVRFHELLYNQQIFLQVDQDCSCATSCDYLSCAVAQIGKQSKNEKLDRCAELYLKTTKISL